MQKDLSCDRDAIDTRIRLLVDGSNAKPMAPTRAESLERHPARISQPLRVDTVSREREFFIDNLLVRIHLIIEKFLVDRPCAMGV
jgi:hypothetical protein